MPNSKRLKVEMRAATEEAIEAERELLQAQEVADELMAKAVTKYRGRRLGDGERPPRRRIVLEEIDEGVTKLTPFLPDSVLFTVECVGGKTFEYTVQDMLDEIQGVERNWEQD